MVTLKNLLLDKLKNWKYEYVFLLIAIFWGLINIFIFPPFQTPDEPSQFYRSWGVSDFQLQCEKNIYVNIPTSAINLPNDFNIPEVNAGGLSLNYNFKLFANKISSDKSSVYSSACGYNPIAFAPEAIGINIAKILNLSTLSAFYLARILALISAIILIFFAIKIAPFGKVFLLFFALLPMTIQQISSISADSLSIAGLMLFTSLILYYSQKNKLTYKNLFLILILSIILIQIKPGFIGFTGLLFVLLPKKFPSKKIYALFLLLALAFNAFVALQLNKLTVNNLHPALGWVVNPTEQIKFIEHHPFSYLDIIWKNIHKNSINYFQMLIGNLGWLSIKFTNAFYISILILFFTLFFFENESISLNFFQRTVIIASFLFSVILVFTAMYLYWSSPGSSTILGIQGRYFIGIMPLLAFGLYKIKKINLLHIKQLTKAHKVLFVIIIFCTISIISLKTVYAHYYKQKDYLTVKPMSRNVSHDFAKIILQTYNLQEISNTRWIATSDDPQIIINPAKIKGISFSIYPNNPVQFYYLFSNSSFSENNSDIIYLHSGIIFINLDILRKKFNKQLVELRLDPTNMQGPFEISNFTIYR